MEGSHQGLKSSGKNCPVQQRDFEEFRDDRLTLFAHQECVSWSDSELDSDIEDAIYAQIYFDENEEAPNNSATGETNIDNKNQSFDFLSISLHMSDNEKEKEEEEVSTKKKKKSKKNSKRGRKGRDEPNEGNLIHEISGENRSQVVCMEDRDQTFPHASLDPSESKVEGNELRKQDKARKLKSRARERQMSSVTVDVLDGGNSRQLNAIESRCSAVKEKGKDDGGVIEILSSSQSGSESDLYIVGVDGAKDEGVRQLARRDFIVISSDSEPARHDKDGSDSGAESSESSGSGSPQHSSEMELCSEGEIVEDVDELWHIVRKDVMGRDAYERRFEGREGMGRYYAGKFKKCYNCKQKGHTDKECPHPKRHRTCYLCAALDHVSSSCPQDLCSYCYRPKHRGRSCGVPWASPKTQCNRCFMTGHHASICPDQWRQFHNTTYTDRQLVMFRAADQRQNQRVFCYNCAQKGHFGFECTKDRMKFSPLPHLPLIAKYDAEWPPRWLHKSRRVDGATNKQSPMKRRVSYNSSQLPPSKRLREQDRVHRDHTQPDQGVERRYDRRLSTPLLHSSMELSRPPLLVLPPGFRDSFRSPLAPEAQRDLYMPPCTPPSHSVSRHEMDPPRRAFSDPRSSSRLHEKHYPRDPLPHPKARHDRRSSDHFREEEDYPRTPFTPPRTKRSHRVDRELDRSHGRSNEPVPPPPLIEHRRHSDISDRRFSDTSDRRFLDNRGSRRFSDFSDKTRGFERTELFNQEKYTAHPDGFLHSERGFRGSQHAARVANRVNHDWMKRRNSYRY